MKKKILVEGPFLTQSGYGEHARFVLRSLRSQENYFDIYAIPLNWGQTSWMFEDNEERKWFDSIISKTIKYIQIQGKFDIYVHVGIPNELKRKAPVTIEVTAGIESNKVAPEWLDICNRECDKIITVSEHSKDAFLNTSWKAQDQYGTVHDLKLNVPIEVVGYPVKDFNKFTEEFTKEKLFLDYDFNFLCVAQWGPRKNLPNTINLFLEEFKNEKVGLVCKVNNSNNSLLDRTSCEKTLSEILKSYPDRKCKIYLLHGDMSEEEIHNLYVHPQIKAIINFGHGEGFGLPLFEAAYCGLPVIAPDYSGHRDFLYAEVDGKIKALFSRVPFEMKKIQQEAVWNGVLHPESEWAYIKPLGAKLAMREVFKDYGRFKGQAKKLKEYILNKKEDVNLKLSNTILGKVSLTPELFNGISFCIPTDGKKLQKTKLLINSIKKQIGKPFEIILCGDVDNFVKEKDIVLVDEKDASKSNKTGVLRNKLAETAKYDVIAWCDDDIILDKNWMANTVEFSEKNGWDVLGNKIFSPDGSRFWDRATINPHSLTNYEESEGSPNIYQTSTFFLTRKKVWDKVKWNENTQFSEEEKFNEGIQYSLQLKKEDFLLYFNKDSLVWHNDENYTQFNNKSILRETISKEIGFEIPYAESKKFTSIKELCDE